MSLATEIFAQPQSSQALYAALPVLLFCSFLFFLTHNAPHWNYPVIGSSRWALSAKKARDSFIYEGKERLFEGVKTGRPFQVISEDGPTIIFPSKYMDEFRNEPRLSFGRAMEMALFANLPGFDALKVISETSIIRDTARINLTQSLNLITGDLCEETDFSTSLLFGESKEWRPITLASTIPEHIARISTRVFLGPVLARNEDWLKIAIGFTVNVVNGGKALRRWHPLLHSIVQWFLPECREVRHQRNAGRELIAGEMKRRQDITAKNEKPKKTADALGWLQENARNGNYSKSVIEDGQLSLTLAAIHTTSDLLSKVLIRLASVPEHAQELRQEILRVVSEEDTGSERLKRTSLYQMRLLDSFLKETQRMTPMAWLPVGRTAKERITLKDGTVIPKNGYLRITVDSSYDNEIFPNAESFDPHRFLKLRSQPGQENYHQFATTSNDHLGFGHGMHACPGRFFVSNELKIALCWLLLKYDWTIDEDNVPAIYDAGGSIVSLPGNKLLCRRRQEEIDMSALF